MKDNHSPSFEPYWWETEEKGCFEKNGLPNSIDILIIGAGYTGLSAGIVASDSGAKTLVVDAGEVGKGASTRNGGMFGAHPRIGWEHLSSNFGSETADSIFREASESMRFVRKIIRTEQISCDLMETGRLQLAWSQSDHEKQKKLVSIMNEKTNINVKIVPKNELIHEIKTERYFGGILFENHCGINPLKFHNGLVNSLKRRKIQIVERMPVLSVESEGNSFKVHFLKQVVFAKKVIMATNGYTLNEFPWFKKRVFPVPSFLIATENIPSELIKELSPRGRMMVETRAKNSYFRNSPDGKKIIFGGRAAIKPISLDLAARRLKASLDDIWPQMKQFQISNVWTGNTGFSFNQIPHVGKHKGIYYAMGYSGSGTVLAAYLGAKVAYQALDDRRGLTGYSKTSLRKSSIHMFEKPYFLFIADFWYQNVIDRLQRR